MKKDKPMIGLRRALLMFCLSLFILANQTRILGGVCASSPCSSLNSSSLVTDHVKDRYAEEKTNLILAPTGLLIPSLLAHLDGLEVIVMHTKSNLLQSIQFDKENETFDLKKDRSPYVSVVRANESHLYVAFILIKLVILLNLIWWLPVGWFFYRMLEKYRKNTKTLFSFLLTFVIIFRLFLAFIDSF